MCITICITYYAICFITRTPDMKIFGCIWLRLSINLLNFSSILLIYSMDSSFVDSQCKSWERKPSNPMIYWINGNHTFHRKKQFYAYMSYLNFLHHRIKWKINLASLNRILEKGSLPYFANSLKHMLETFSSHIFALTSASNHLQMYVDLNKFALPIIEFRVKYLFRTILQA